MMACINTQETPCAENMKGQIQIIFGPMFSGKTTELIRRMKRYSIANYECLIIKYANDTRYTNEGLSTHDKQNMAATSTKELMTLKEEALNYDVIGVDEGQFFPDVVQFCELMAESGKKVVVAALDGTYQRQGFGDILQLVPLAEHVVKLTAVCMTCFGDASFTKRKGQEKQIEVIGGADKYLAVCRQCYKQSPVKNSPRPSPAKSKMSQHPKTSAQARLFGTSMENAMEMSS